MEEKELLLREDRRLLGRLLGEVIREQVGEAALERIERIRQTAVAFHKEASSRAELERELNALNLEQTLHLVRAFSYFSHLLNIAEDEQQHRRRRAYADARSPRRAGSFSYALDRAREAGVEAPALLAWFARAQVAPVLTAHPTEVQRQSILDCEREIARLISQPASPERDELLHAEILRLWLTAMLRGTRLEVSDEVANGLAYFRLTFLNQLPRLYAEFEHALEGDVRARRRPRLPPFLTVGTWIGGDRDGNPFVTADGDARRARAAGAARPRALPRGGRPALQGARALGAHPRGAAPRSRRSPPPRAKARPTGATSPIGARSRASTRASQARRETLAELKANPPADACSGRRIANADEFSADLDVIASSLEDPGRRPPRARAAARCCSGR